MTSMFVANLSVLMSFHFDRTAFNDAIRMSTSNEIFLFKLLVLGDSSVGKVGGAVKRKRRG